MSFLFAGKSFSQLKSYKFEQIDSLQIIQKRNIVVFIYTDWCKFCAAMKNTTLRNKAIVATLNNSFYFIDLNAEEKRAIVFNGKKYSFKPTGYQTGIHELATALGTVKGSISYPTLCILNKNNGIVFHYNSFLNANDFLSILQQYF